jgi:hypothetical protein
MEDQNLVKIEREIAERYNFEAVLAEFKSMWVEMLICNASNSMVGKDSFEDDQQW